jgi:hypothetical protein
MCRGSFFPADAASRALKRFSALRASRHHSPVASATAEVNGIHAMKKTLITAAVALGLDLFSAPTFAKSYVVNDHTASAAEAQLLVSNGVQPGA